MTSHTFVAQLNRFQVSHFLWNEPNNLKIILLEIMLSPQQDNSDRGEIFS